jgi:HSP20 family molecular chaperone IbpA
VRDREGQGTLRPRTGSPSRRSHVTLSSLAATRTRRPGWNGERGWRARSRSRRASSDAPAERVPASPVGRGRRPRAFRERLRPKGGVRSRPAVNPLEVHCDADAVRSVLEFDRLAEQIAAGARTPRPFPMDPYRRGDEFVVSFDPPGMAPGTIDLTVEQNVLTINAERRFDGQEGDEVIAAERLQARLPASCSWRDARRRAPRGQLRNRGADVANPGRRFGEAPQGADHRRRRRPDDRGSDHAGRRVEPLSQNAPASAAAV